MAHALIITAKPSGGLSYADNDVVQVLDGHQNPGARVTPPDSGFLFCYVSDKEHDDPELVALMEPLVDSGDPEVTLAKRRYAVELTGAAFETWVPEDQAATAGIQKTWAEVQALLTDKESA